MYKLPSLVLLNHSDRYFLCCYLLRNDKYSPHRLHTLSGLLTQTVPILYYNTCFCTASSPSLYRTLDQWSRGRSRCRCSSSPFACRRHRICNALARRRSNSLRPRHSNWRPVTKRDFRCLFLGKRGHPHNAGPRRKSFSRRQLRFPALASFHWRKNSLQPHRLFLQLAGWDHCTKTRPAQHYYCYALRRHDSMRRTLLWGPAKASCFRYGHALRYFEFHSPCCAFAFP